MVKKKKTKKKALKVVKKKKVVRRKKRIKAKAPRLASLARGKGPKVIGKVEHFFGKISVIAFKLKTPLKIGDRIQIKGHTTDFVQAVGSMQINHQNVDKAKKGQDVGFRVNCRCRVGDTVFEAAPEMAQPVQQRPATIQLPSFPAMTPKSQPKPAAPPPASNQPKPYGETKFLKF
ncbi:MAG: hypothetical protein ABH823_05710 [bacterium]